MSRAQPFMPQFSGISEEGRRAHPELKAKPGSRNSPPRASGGDKQWDEPRKEG